MSYYIRGDMASITVKVGGDEIFAGAEWATYSGGELEADDQKTRPGGMKGQVAIGGPTSRSDITCTIQFTDVVAKKVKADKWESRAGRGTFEATVTFLDSDGNGVAETAFTRKGIVKRIKIPDVDVNTGEVAFLEVVGSMDEVTT